MVRLLESKERKSKGSLLSTLAVTTLGLHFAALFFLILQGLTIRQLSLRKPPNFVQQVDGKQTASSENLAREPEVIRQFISKTMTLMFNWSGKLPPQTLEEVAKPKIDSGINIRTTQGISRKVSTSSWMASFALSEDFRKGYLSQIAAITPPEVFTNSSNTGMSGELKIKRIYPPQQIAPGKWRVGMVADFVQKKRDDNREIITPLNQEFLVQAVDSFNSPLAEKASDLQKVIYGIRSDKLEIYEIRKLSILDKYTTPNESFTN